MNIKENITKFSDLQNNDSLSSFMNHHAQQNHSVYEIFYNFLSEVKPKRILEIGTALGGFTQFLKICVDDLLLDTKILSYDVVEKPWYENMRTNGIDVRVENIFFDDYKVVKDEVLDFIKQDGVTMVLCDGGWKIGEFNILSNYIKSGDFIMAHDYAHDKETFDKKINRLVWNWHEISESDISESCLRNNLIDYNRSEFEQCVWVCKIKQ